MSDYDKLTVVKLREELVKRGLPKSGLKAVLVSRLIEADAQAGPAQVAPQNQEPEQSNQIHEIEEATTRTPPPAQNQSTIEEDGVTGNDAPQPPVAGEEKTVDDTLEKPFAVPAIEQDTTVEVEGKNEKGAINAAQNEEATPEVPESEAVGHDPDLNVSARPSPQSEHPPEPYTAPMEGVESQLNEQASTPQALENSSTTIDSTQIITAASTQTSISRQELAEDTNKRKRRSQSPPPSSIETAQKKARAHDGRPHVKLPEDFETDEKPVDGPKQSDEDMADAPRHIPHDIARNGHGQSHPDYEESEDDPKIGGDQTQPLSDQKETSTHSASVESHIKPSPSDTRFKNLFTAPSKREGSPPHHSLDLENDDRVITPATHPATSALYIRDIMRPLHPDKLKDHLIALATPPGSAPDTEIVTDFFLDSIKTHCLVGFTNSSAAARVRSGLHDRVWPDERTRKPLWVDFVPEEKLKKWIEVEFEASTRRGQSTKRWEVVYEEEEDGLKAYLQEAGSNSSAPRPGPSRSSRLEAGQGVQGAPSGPRNRDPEPRMSQSGPTSKPDYGKGFQALDDLFKSTAAKPKLYYLPVAKTVADRRLQTLAAGRGGGRSDEMRRFTFEADTIVDRGPEFGSRSRVGYGGRGGGYRGDYHGRGGGWRGDWRDRR